MKKVYLKQQLKELNDYTIEVIKSLSGSIEILDNNYGLIEMQK